MTDGVDKCLASKEPILLHDEVLVRSVGSSPGGAAEPSLSR